MKITNPKDIKNTRYHFIGAILIILNRIRHGLFGYKTPRPFSASQIERSVNYDFKLVEEWMQYVQQYVQKEDFLCNKTILELGPGPDLGTGLILLSKGARKYFALDINNLAMTGTQALYGKLFEKLEKEYPSCNLVYLKDQLKKRHNKENSAINYIVDKDFGMEQINDAVDIVFSQAAFEHFVDVEKTIKELNKVVKPGGILIAEVDLKTHTRWIRDRDPLNIYRYNKAFWKIFSFKGSPNRLRTFEYKKILESNGWIDVKVVPLNVVEDKYLGRIQPKLSRKFKDMDSSEMKMLSIMLMAKKE
jgi:SAM-dependent methyltransferase